MRRRLGVIAALHGAVACSSASAPVELAATTRSAIEDGTVDTSDTFAVAVVQESNELIFCSGMLLGPNLVATARHCVAQLSSEQIQCSTSTFGSVLPVTDFGVSTATQLGRGSTFVGVSKIIVPSGSNQTNVCGNDLALMILDRSIELPQYVTPVIQPPMTDHQLYSTEVTVIGYGLSSPTDEAGASAGVRRIKEDVALTCIPNDPGFADCFSDPNAKQFISASEFVSGDDSTCEGDSGSGAFEQSSFNNKKWVAFGVLSRGGLSADGQTCVQPIYTRFDAWGSLLVQTAIEAASVGGYPAPAWAGGDAGTAAPSGASTASSGSASSFSGSGANGAAVSGAPSSSGSSASPGASSGGSSQTSSGLGNGVQCNLDSDCESKYCVSVDNVNFYCASPCNGASCPAMFACQSGYCFPESQDAGSSTTSESPTGNASHGCAISAGRPRSFGDSMVGALSALAGLTVLGRRRHRSATRVAMSLRSTRTSSRGD
jgi:trypsin